MEYKVITNDGGTLVLENKGANLLIDPLQLVSFNLKDGDIVRDGSSRLYSYVNIVAKKVKLGERREGWDYLTNVQVIPYKEEITLYKERVFNNLGKYIEDYIDRSND